MEKSKIPKFGTPTFLKSGHPKFGKADNSEIRGALITVSKKKPKKNPKFRKSDDPNIRKSGDPEVTQSVLCMILHHAKFTPISPSSLCSYLKWSVLLLG